MRIDATIDAMSGDDAKAALKRLLTASTTPAFGALSKREADLALFCEMTRLGIVDQDASVYDLMMGMRITRAKASQLLFDREVRARSAGDLDAALIAALATAGFERNGDRFSIEIENPLLQAHLRERLRRLGHQSDASFNPTLVRMTLEAVRDVAVDLMPSERRKEVDDALRKAGAPEEGLRGMVGAALKVARDKAVGAAGDAATDAAKGYVGTLLTGAAPAIVATFAPLLGG